MPPQKATRRKSIQQIPDSRSTSEKQAYLDLLFVTVTLVVLLFLTRCGLDTVWGLIVLVTMLAHRCSRNPAFQSAVVALAALLKSLKGL
jgi:hypothetical protein